MNSKDQLEYANRLREAAKVFQPNHPITSQTVFRGRTKQIIDLISFLPQAGQHAIVFGERGVGKTSLARVTGQIMKATEDQEGFEVVHVNCDALDTFQSIWRKVFREIVLVTQTKSLGFNSQTKQVQQPLDGVVIESFSPEDVRYWLEQVNKPFLIFLDEFDRIKDKQVTVLVADTIKSLSDHIGKTKLVIVGVAKSVSELMVSHQSIERCLLLVNVPRMSDSEIREIVAKGFESLSISINESEIQWIVWVSQGMPHYAHLICNEIVKCIAADSRTTIKSEDIACALSRSVDIIEQGLLDQYRLAVHSTRKTHYEEILIGSAFCRKDEMGYFSASDVCQTLKNDCQLKLSTSVIGRCLKMLATSERGKILEITGKLHSYKFKIVNAMMPSFLIMRGVDKGIIKKMLQ